MTSGRRLVVDTNVLVSRLLVPASKPGMAVRTALERDQLLISDDTLFELADVLSRPKFDKYITVRDRQQFLRLLSRVAERVPISYLAQACRDPDDNRILDVASNGRADLIITGDGDLLDMRSFQGVAIITPAQYLELP